MHSAFHVYSHAYDLAFRRAMEIAQGAGDPHDDTRGDAGDELARAERAAATSAEKTAAYSAYVATVGTALTSLSAGAQPMNAAQELLAARSEWREEDREGARWTGACPICGASVTVPAAWRPMLTGGILTQSYQCPCCRLWLRWDAHTRLHWSEVENNRQWRER